MSTTDEVRAVALALAGSEECQTWGRATFRFRESIFATLHDDLLILRGELETQDDRLQRDHRMQKAPYWGRYGWVAIPISQTEAEELSGLLTDAYELIAKPSQPVDRLTPRSNLGDTHADRDHPQPQYRRHRRSTQRPSRT